MKKWIMIIETLLTSIKKIDKVGTRISGIFIIIISIYITIDVLLRKIFSISIEGTVEISGYVMAIVSVWSFSHAFLRKAHIRIDIFYMKAPLSMQIVLDILSLFVLVLFVAPLTYYSGQSLYTSILRMSLANTPLHISLWIPQSLWVAGLIFFLITIVFTILGILTYLVNKDMLSAHRLYGSSNVIDEPQNHIQGNIK